MVMDPGNAQRIVMVGRCFLLDAALSVSMTHICCRGSEYGTALAYQYLYRSFSLSCSADSQIAIFNPSEYYSVAGAQGCVICDFD